MKSPEANLTIAILVTCTAAVCVILFLDSMMEPLPDYPELDLQSQLDDALSELNQTRTSLRESHMDYSLKVEELSNAYSRIRAMEKAKSE